MDSRFANPGDQGPFLYYGGTGGTHTLESDFVVVDVETSGLKPSDGARVIEIAAVRINPAGQEIDSMSTLINPGNSNTGADWIHGISSQMIADAPKFDEIFNELARVMDGAIFVAHHAKFDEGFVASEARHNGIELNQMPGLCTYWLSRRTVTTTANHKLGTLAEHFGITQEGAHSALDDARVVAKMLPKMLALHEPLTYFSKPASQPLILANAQLLPR